MQLTTACRHGSSRVHIMRAGETKPVCGRVQSSTLTRTTDDCTCQACVTALTPAELDHMCRIEDRRARNRADLARVEIGGPVEEVTPARDFYPVGTAVRFVSTDTTINVARHDRGTVVQSFAPDCGRNVLLADGRIVNCHTDEIEPAPPIDPQRPDSPQHAVVRLISPFGLVMAHPGAFGRWMLAFTDQDTARAAALLLVSLRDDMKAAALGNVRWDGDMVTLAFNRPAAG